MADDRVSKASSSKNLANSVTDESDYDPTLDFTSDKFDPLKALESPNVILPAPYACTFDNIAKYYSTYKTLPTKQDSVVPKPSTSQNTAPVTTFQRKFQPDQMPTVTTKPTKKNLLMRMELFEGALKKLKQCIDDRNRLQIWTRHSHGIRGYCLAYVVAFDKHWNMILEDVTEVWTRSRNRKSLLGPFEPLNTSKLRIVPTKVVTKKISKNKEQCERHVPRLLIRGEHVVFIKIM